MDAYSKPTASSLAHPETMDFLSHAWCDFAVQALQPELPDRSIILLDNPILEFDDTKTPILKMDKSMKMNESIPPWKSNDLKSWISMQQAMHPELNYNSCFREKWGKLPWKIIPFKIASIKKWLKEIKLKKKEDERLKRAEVHAAISVAGVAAALAAIAAAENSSKQDSSSTPKSSALASAAALVAAECAKVAEAMGAKREELSSVIGSAISGTSASDILTLTAAASTSLRGAAALKVRRGCKQRLSGSAPVLPIEDNNHDGFDFEKYRLILSKGTELNTENPDGKCAVRLVSIVLNDEGKVILKTKKLNILNSFSSMKPSIVLDLHAELYKDTEEHNTCYLIVLTTNQGTIKLDMSDDYLRYKTWTMTINHMLMLSTSFTRYELQFYKN